MNLRASDKYHQQKSTKSKKGVNKKAYFKRKANDPF